MNDLELLRRYEPVLRFTYGELFFPCAVDPYVDKSSLWLRHSDGKLEQAVSPEDLTLNTLAQHHEIEPGQTLFLQFVQEPLEGVPYQRWKHRASRPRFQAPGRLARVGIAARLLDSFFSLSLVLRGTVPGGTTGAAAIQYAEIMSRRPEYVYYGRVVREGGYIILHYLFFYAMNDWRTSFHGVNDHEADWEQMFVYLAEQPDGLPAPEWIAYASHDYTGDNLRRRWDDPTITREGDHPVVFVGAGSHSSYFERGEFLHSVQLVFLKPLFSALHIGERLWRNVLRQGDPEALVDRIEGFLSVPFVDYARGDGLAVGPGQDVGWSPVVMCDDMSWVHEYRGLWGYDARDPLAGETAPGGPKFNRDGTMRHTWHNPLGWAGLHKVAPTPRARETLRKHLDELGVELVDTEATIQRFVQALPRLELEVRALQKSNHSKELFQQQQEALREQEEALNNLYTTRAALSERMRASSVFLKQIEETGDFGDPQAHIRRRHVPQSETVVQQGKLAEGWAALSIGLLLLFFVGLMLSGVASWIAVLALVTGMFFLVEAFLYRKLERLLLNATILLAVLATAVLIWEFFWYILVAGAVALATLIITDNMRELRG
ncbi:MAG: hypothetical protein H0V47_06835 [Chloroflexia bacterium]|nr:hypothetical protein [Chloroflexia bacterium]